MAAAIPRQLTILHLNDMQVIYISPFDQTSQSPLLADPLRPPPRCCALLRALSRPAPLRSVPAARAATNRGNCTSLQCNSFSLAPAHLQLRHQPPRQRARAGGRRRAHGLQAAELWPRGARAVLWGCLQPQPAVHHHPGM